MFDLIIIGGGPAGVAAGVYAARKRMRTVLLTKDIGGQSVNSATIENFIGHTLISGFDFSRVLEEQLRAQEGLDLRIGTLAKEIRPIAGGYEVVTSRDETLQTKYILFALGSTYRRLEVPGEDTYEGKGIFYCSICDAPLMKGKDALVVGGGNSGLEAVLDLAPYAKSITLIDKLDVLRGDVVLQEKIAQHPHVSIRLHRAVQKFEGEQFLQKAVIQDIASGVVEELSVSGAFISIGWVPNTKLVRELVDIDASGRIIVDHTTMQTSRPGIWAAGDCTDGRYHQINTAIGDGVNAALHIYDTLRLEQ